MIYLLVSRGRKTDGSVKIEAGTPLHLKVSGSDNMENPIIGFDTLALANDFLDRKKIPKDDYKLILKGDGLGDNYENHPIFLVKNKSQLDEMESDAEGYDYQKYIYKNAL
jgi:hypothetical protein